MKKTNPVTKTLAIILTVLMIFASLPFAPIIASAETSFAVGDYVQFGTYPQTKVLENESLKAAAETAVWRSYEYYTGTGVTNDGCMTSSDYMMFADFFCGEQKYRAVRFSSYRPVSTGYKSNASNSNQDNNGYYINNTYYFLYKPLLWRVMEPSSGLIMCQSIIDGQAFQNVVYKNKTDYGWNNSYYTSSIRAWLNRDFYQTAFTDEQKSMIQPSVLNNAGYVSTYSSSATKDKIFLLSYTEALNTTYGFSSSYAGVGGVRAAKGTDYAKCQGIGVSTSEGYEGNSRWCLRTAGNNDPLLCYVYTDGSLIHENSNINALYGIRPVCRLSNLESNADQSNVLYSASRIYHTGDLIAFGNYPQTQVPETDSLENAPKEWASYQYYSGTGSEYDGNMHPSDYMQFADFFCNGAKYRAVRFTDYRPIVTGFKCNEENSNQDENGYFADTTYYFRYEPLIWRILNPTFGFIICENVIDSQAFQNCITPAFHQSQDSNSSFANVYGTSSLQHWLNYDFYETAFSEEQKSIVHDSPTFSISILSKIDATNTALGFTSSEQRVSQGSDYARCQGLSVSTATNTYGNSGWWLRTAYEYHWSAYSTGNSGGVGSSGVNHSNIGVKPVCMLYSLTSNTSQVLNLFSGGIHIHTPSEPIQENVEGSICEAQGRYDEVTYCKDCGEELNRITIDDFSVGHDWGDWTKLNDNEHQRICKRDASHTETASHVWNEGVVTKEPTCKEQGSKFYTCTVCDATKTEPIAIDPDNHADYGTHLENVSAATCLEAGYTGDTVCNGCGATLAVGETIDPLGPNVKMLNVQKISDWQTVFSEDPQLLTFTYKENKDDEFVWIAQVTPTPGLTQYRVTDTLPEGVELVDVKVMPGPNIAAWNYGKTDYPGTLLTIDANGALSGEIGNLWMSRTIASGQLSTGADGRQVVDITLTANSASSDLFGNTFYVIYYCKLSEDAWPANGTVHLTLNNTVSVESNGDDYGQADNTIIIDASNTQNIVNKTGDWNKNTHMITYSVDINPAAENLLTSNEGTVDPDWLTFTDVLSYQAKQGTGTGEAILSLNSVFLEAENNGVWTPMPDIQWTAHTENDATDANVKNANITMRIPDETHLRLTYSYRINSSMADGITLSNSATVEGHGDESGDDNTHISGEDFQTSGESTFEEFCLIKIDQENGMPLSGAVFTVYTWDAVNEEWSALTKTYTTDQFGRIIIKVTDQYENGTRIYQKDTAYCIMETTAPPGYILPVDPRPFYFWFSEELDAPQNAPDDFMLTAADISTSSRRIEAENMCEYVNTCDSGHDWDEWIDNGDDHLRTCKRCALEETADHVWNDGVVTIQPKAETPGEMTYTCTVCGAVKTEPIPVIGWTVTFKDDNGDALGTQTGATLEEAKGKQSDPTKDATAQYTYAFDHWDQVTANETTGEAAFVAVYIETLNSYTVTFKDENGDVLKTQTIAYGSAATTPADPAKGDDENKHYEFAGWDQDFSNITGNLTVTATYTGEAHISKEVVTVPATCEGEGTKQIVCEVCNRLLDTQTIDPLGHDWGAWSASGENHTRSCMRDGCNATQTEAHAWTKIGETNADCTNAGSITWRCDVCSAQKTETVDPNGHQLVKTEAVAATCLEDGNSAYYTCSVCGLFFSDEAAQNEIAENSWVIGALGHDWNAWTKLNDNEHQRICKRDASHKETASHVWNDGVVTKEPTCKEHGSILFTCTVCEATKTEPIAINPNNHADYGTHLENEADATCLEKGYTGDTVCNGCGVTLTAGEDIDPLNHDWDGWTDNGDGNHIRVCKRDASHVETAAHVWNEWETVTAPTYDENGLEKRVCPVCSAEETRPINKLQSWTVTFVVDDADGTFEYEGKTYTVVGKPVRFTSVDDVINPPAVPTIEGYVGQWKPFTLTENDLVVPAIYTKKADTEESELETTKESSYENGIAEITLDAFARTNNVKTELGAKPYDIILVVDQSGSMAYVMNEDREPNARYGETAADTRNAKLKGVANSFVDMVAATGLDHRIAIVGFGMASKAASGISAYQNTAVLTPGKTQYGLNQDMQSAYENAFVSVKTDKATLTSAINGIQAKGATAADLGFEMAKGILANTDSTGRKRLVIFLTDGEPTYSSSFEDDVANRTVNYSYLLKNVYGASVYSIAISGKANPEDETQNFNRFLHQTSSNYPFAKFGESGTAAPKKAYYYATTDATELENIFKDVFASTVSNTISFDKVTLYDTISKYFTMTVSQEEALRASLKAEYGATQDDVVITRNEDGTTSLSVCVAPKAVFENNIQTGYGATVTFRVSANENAVEAGYYDTNTADAGVLDGNGNLVASFEIPKIYIPQNRVFITFKAGDEIYEIRDVRADEEIIAPQSSIGVWHIEPGTTVTENGTVFEAVLNSNERLVKWNTGSDTVVQSYKIGQLIYAPAVDAPEGMSFSGWDNPVPNRMPTTNLEFTATFTPHTHAWKKTGTSGNCETGMTTTYNCVCGETKEQITAPTNHVYTAIITRELDESVVTMTCSVCGAYTSQHINYQTQYDKQNKDRWGRPAGTTTTAVDLTLYNAQNVVIQPDADKPIMVYIPITAEQKASKDSLEVYRIEEGDQKTRVDSEVVNDYIVLHLDHFSYYLISAEETLPTYGETVCAIHGHSYTDTVTPPTCTEQGYTTHTCPSCGDTYTDSEVPAKNHSYGAWTKLNDDQHQRVCANDSTHVEKANHTWDGGTVTKPATCKATGIKTYTCTACNATKTETIAITANAHSLTFVPAKSATTEAEGNVAYYHCSLCGKNYSDQNGTQQLTKVTTDKLPKPTEPQKNYNDCKYCGEKHTGAFGWLIKFFHSILALFGLRK